MGSLLKRMPIVWRLRLVTVVTMVILGLVSVSAYFWETAHQQDGRIAVVKGVVQSAAGIAAEYEAQARQGRMSEPQAKDAAITAIRAIRYFGDSYVWISDIQARMVMHPIRSDLDGRDLNSWTDASGKRLTVAFAEIVQASGSGILSYSLPRPGDQAPVPKLSYVEGFRPWGWIIGSGVHVGDLAEARRQIGLGLVVVTILIGAVVGCLLDTLGRGITGPVIAMEAAMHRLAAGDDPTEIPALDRGDEVGQMARAMLVFRENAEQAGRFREAEEERRRAEHEIVEQHARFGRALDNMSQGLLMFDRGNVLLLANAAVKKILGLPSDSLAPGMTISEVILTAAGVGNLAQSAPAAIAFYTGLVEKNVASTFLRKLPDGRQLSSNFAPYDSGWLITFEDMTVARSAEDRLAHMAMHDALTGLPNRLKLRARTEEALERVRGTEGFAIICLDLDHFKNVNDTLGHSAGDKLLCEVASRIQSVTRQSDIVARLGGDEFAIVVSPFDTKVSLAEMATRLVDAIAAPYWIDGQTAFVGASLGIALAPADGADPERLMKSADLALYRAKNEGRGRFAFFEPRMEQHMIERRQVEHELYDALTAGEFQLHYQPLVQVAGRLVVGFEALLRWFHPVRGMVPPADFIPVAEENGFIIRVGEWVLREACREAAGWPHGIKVAVNLSPVQFRSGTFVQAVTGALAASGLAANRLELEITEGTMMRDSETTLATLKELKALGIRIAMDDFGTGYSSLAYLQKFPFDKIKIDRAFVRDIAQPTSLAIIRAVTGIAESLSISTLAEGVETESQFAAVANAQCNEAQGYLFSRPRPASEVMLMLAREAVPVATVDMLVMESVAG